MSQSPAKSAPSEATGASAWHAYAALTLGQLFWGGNFVVGRWAAGQVPPMTLALLRWTGAILVLLPFAWPYLKRDWAVIRANWPILVLLGVTGPGLFNTVQYISLSMTTATSAAVINSSGPILIALACLALFGDRISLLQVFGILVSLAGVILVVTQGAPLALLDLALNRGDLVMLAAMAIWALYTAFLRKRPQLHWVSFAAVQYIIAVLVNLPLAGYEAAIGKLPVVTPQTLAALAYVALLPSLVSYALYARGVALIGGLRAGAFMHMIALFAPALAIIFLGERPEAYHFVGFGLILAGVMVAARRG